MLRPLDPIEQRADVVVGEACSGPSQIAGLHAKRFQPLRLRALRKRAAQMVVDDRLEGPTSATRLRLQACRDIVL